MVHLDLLIWIFPASSPFIPLATSNWRTLQNWFIFFFPSKNNQARIIKPSLSVLAKVAWGFFVFFSESFLVFSVLQVFFFKRKRVVVMSWCCDRSHPWKRVCLGEGETSMDLYGSKNPKQPTKVTVTAPKCYTQEISWIQGAVSFVFINRPKNPPQFQLSKLNLASKVHLITTMA